MTKSETDTDDPLEGADVGETHTICESVELHTIDFEPEVFYGSDRFSDSTVADIEVVEDEYGDEILVVTFEGEVTKALPRRWDRSREPLTDTEATAQRRKRWLGKALAGGLVAGTVVISTVISSYLMGQLSGNMTINGEPVQAPGVWTYASLAALMLILVWAIRWLPGRIGRNGGRVA